LLAAVGILVSGGAALAWSAQAAPTAGPTTAPPATAPQHATAATFDVNEIRVDGSTVLPQEQVEETIYPYLGPGKTAADIEAARAALQNAYKTAGFITVSVDRARWVDKANGVIGLKVVERRVERLRVTHARYFVPDAVRDGAPSLAPGKVPNMRQVSADLVGLNQLPDRTVQPNLKPGREPDTVDVDLDVSDKFPLHGTLELNNRYNADTSHLRLNASLTYDNFFQRGDSGTINYSVAPEDVRDAEIESASYLFHIPDSRLSLLMTYLHSNSNVVALGTTDVAGRGTTGGFRLLIPLGTTADSAGGSFTQSFSVGWDYKRFYELDTFNFGCTAGAKAAATSKSASTKAAASGVTSTNIEPGTDTKLPTGCATAGATPSSTAAPITYYPLNAAYAANWTGPHSTTDVNISVELNVDHLGSTATQFDNKRYLASPGFSLLRATITREQDLPHDVQLWGSLSGQLSNDALISSEQFALGGADSIRGYLEAETLGDYGVTLQTELRSPDIHRYIGGPVNSWRFHIFGDTGLVDTLDDLPASHSTYGLSSAGVGTRVNLWGYLNGALQDAQTLNRGPDTKPGTNRVLFRVFGEF
jgi:hemolysin activation/secretion protein